MFFRILLFFCLITTACKKKQAVVLQKPLPLPVIIDLGTLDAGIFENTEFGICMAQRNGHDALAWLDREKNICFQPVAVKAMADKIPFRHVAGIPENYNVRFAGDTLFFFDFTNKLFIVNKLGKDTATVLQVFNLAPLLKKYNCIINYQNWNIFEINYPLLYLALASEIRKDNFIYPFSYASIKLLKNSECALQSMYLHTPKKYYKRKEYNTDKFFRFLDDTTFVYGFQTFDSIYTGSTNNGQIIAKADFNPVAEYRVFKHSKVMDKAYVRWHINTNETNLNMFTSNGKIVIIKQRQRKELKDSTHYEYYVLDRQLQTIFHAPFAHAFNYRLSFPYKKGFLVINPIKSEGYYYEIPD